MKLAAQQPRKNPMNEHITIRLELASFSVAEDSRLVELKTVMEVYVATSINTTGVSGGGIYLYFAIL